MSSFNRPPRSFGFPSYDAAAERASAAGYATAHRGDPSFAAFEPPAALEPPTPTHSWLNLDLIPSWLRPFTLDANTRFTRTPDHFLRPRETETAALPELPGRGWHFVLDPADDEPVPAAPAAAAEALLPAGASRDTLQDAPWDAPFAHGAEPPEAGWAAASLDAPFAAAAWGAGPHGAQEIAIEAAAMDGPAAEEIAAGAPGAEGSMGEEAAAAAPLPPPHPAASPAGDLAPAGDVMAGPAAPDAAAHAARSEAEVGIAVETAAGADPAGEEPVRAEKALPAHEEAVPAHFVALTRLLVLGRAAMPPAPAADQDLAPAAPGTGKASPEPAFETFDLASEPGPDPASDSLPDLPPVEAMGEEAVFTVAQDIVAGPGAGAAPDLVEAPATEMPDAARAEDPEGQGEACGAADAFDAEWIPEAADDAAADPLAAAGATAEEDIGAAAVADAATQEDRLAADRPEDALPDADLPDADLPEADTAEAAFPDVQAVAISAAPADAEAWQEAAWGEAAWGEAAWGEAEAPSFAPAPVVAAPAPVSAEPAPAPWRPYQQSISARFLGAVAPASAFAAPAPEALRAAPATTLASVPAPPPAPAAAPAAAEAGDDACGYDLPPLDLLREPPVLEPDYELSEEFLDQSSAMLQQVLRDFGVRGEVIDANPGPVVTLYEFEPAPGVKSSRVIGLSPDIARSMSAVSARVAVVEGRNVIGIELPNRRRDTVWLRELLASHEFVESRPKLGLCLGKTIGGAPVIADLARMPHLLVAGTTGSGKSVAINTMILSLLYRHTPEACRLIMIDPKMLELSIYEGIPHLLTPVVTDPKKAIIALKWAVKEMEERYKKMSRLAVRNIDGYNARVREAAEKGEVITRNVQVGFDKESGEALFEEQEMDLAPLPYIVVIVDEMADLMMVAGKEIEGAIQRLAQMARAAGIHLVMATQRPSVDVITGTIKANFPTRISFQVTSKIDSRTILGEMGAETLLGQGDMLFMAGGGRIMRVHGPFVSDGEVEHVVAFLKAQGGPDYLDAVVLDEDAEVDDEDDAVFDRSGLAEAGGDLYEQAVAIVMRDRKASTSYIQRRLQVGYNKAASLMERMETEGIVGPANHAGKREILTFSRPG